MPARYEVLLTPSESLGPTPVTPLATVGSTLFQRARISMIPRSLAFLCFHMLTRSFASSKTQPFYFQAFRRSLDKTPGGGGVLSPKPRLLGSGGQSGGLSPSTKIGGLRSTQLPLKLQF